MGRKSGAGKGKASSAAKSAAKPSTNPVATAAQSDKAATPAPQAQKVKPVETVQEAGPTADLATVTENTTSAVEVNGANAVPTVPEPIPSNYAAEVVEEPKMNGMASEEGEISQEASKGEEVKVEAEGKGEVDEEKKEEEGSDDILLFPLQVKGPAGEEIELQVNPADTVMDLKQFLADAPETCFYTCYDLILSKPDGLRYHLVDFVEIGEVADVAKGGCLLEMYNTFYDDRAVRLHVRKTRELISMAGSSSSPSTIMASDYEVAKALATEKDLNGEGDGEKEKEEAEKKDKEEEKSVEKKDKIPELEESLGFAKETAGVLAAITPTGEDGAPQCTESIAFSSFNPAPGHRRLQGDLLYLDIVTAEMKEVCVMATTKGFVVNRSGVGKRLDVRPAEPRVEASTLVGLLRQLSPKFSAAFAEVMEKKSSRHPFENMSAPLPPAAWLAPHPPPDHLREVARAEESLMSPFGIDFSGVLRDWNEELQSCRELPKATLQDRILRDRALYRVSCEFADAAVKGAKAVIGRSIPPINPHDSDRFHMYVHHNIFFSFAVDGDFAILQQIREKDLKEQAEAEAKKKEEGGESEGIKATASEVEGSKEAGRGVEKKGSEKSEGKGEGEGEGESVQVSSQLAGETEQATYASSNNDLKGTVMVNKADVSGISALAMAIVDYRGHRVIAQSIIPGILYGDRTTQMLYGSLDNGKTVKWSEKFHVKVGELGKALRLKEHKVKDKEGAEVTLCSPVESKGILGSDDRQYLLDLIRLTPRDINVPLEPTPEEKEKEGKAEEKKSSGAEGAQGPAKEANASAAISASPGLPNFLTSSSRLAILRPELIDAFCQVEEVDAFVREKGLKKRPSEAEIAALREKGALPAIRFNPNVFTDFTLSGDPKEVAEDEALVRRAGEYMFSTAVPKLVAGLKSAEIRPMDGGHLSKVLHAHGINLRYLGKVAEAVKGEVDYVYQLSIEEMVARATRHVLKAVLRETLDQDVGGAIAHFLNCLLGTSTSTPPPTLPPSDESAAAESTAAAKDGEVVKDELRSEETSTKEAEEGKESVKEGEKKEAFLYVIDRPGYTRITADMVWSDVMEGVKFKYKFELPGDVRTIVRGLPILRNICLKMGIVLAGRDYDLNTEVPIAITDVLDVCPLVKFAAPSCADADQLLSRGKSFISQVGLPLEPKFSGTPMLGTWLRQHEAKLNEAFEVFSEAYQILQQVCGPLHPSVAACCRYLGSIFYHAGETANAVLQMHRELIINERVLGTDHPNTLHSYGNLGVCYQALGESELALRHFKHTLALISASCGPSHPETAAFFLNIALTFQDVGRTDAALSYLQASLECNEKVFGPDHLQCATCHHALALTYSSMAAFKLALQRERKAEAILEKQLGRDDARTKESEQWVQTFLDRELRAQKQRIGVGQTSSAQQQAAALRVAEILKHRPDLLQALQSSGGAGPAYNRAVADALLRGEQPPHAPQPRVAGAAPSTNPGLRGRGVDERAARAAAEARKKAAARGVNLRGKGAAGKGPAVDMEELLNYINSSASALGPTPTPAPARVSGQAAGTGQSSSRVSAGPAPSGLGSGLGVGLGAVSGAPPIKSASSSKKAAVVASAANGEVKEKKLEGTPVGLGAGLASLQGPGSKKGKAKPKKSLANLE